MLVIVMQHQGTEIAMQLQFVKNIQKALTLI